MGPDTDICRFCSWFSTDQKNLPEQKEQIKKRLREKLKINNDEVNQTNSSGSVSSDYFELIYECIETRHILLNIVNFNAHSLIDSDVDLAILQALLNGKRNTFCYYFNSISVATSGNDSSKTTTEQKRDQLYWALEWNRPDIVKNFIMKDDRDWHVSKVLINEMVHAISFCFSIVS